MKFSAPWAAISDSSQDDSDGQVLEAMKEIGPGHPLAGRTLRALARRIDCDDVLFLLDGGPEVAVVHLTYSGRKEADGFPAATVFSSQGEFERTRMKSDRIDYGE